MPFWLSILLGAVALIGQFALGVKLFNRVQATAWPRPLIKAIELALLVAVPVGLGWLGWELLHRDLWNFGSQATGSQLATAAYAAFCVVCGLAVIPLWVVPRMTFKRAAALVDEKSQDVDLVAEHAEPLAGDWATNLWLYFPGNQIFHLSVTEKTLRIPGLPAELEGLTIAHWSDLHMTGQATRRYYREITERTQAMDPELVVLSGDILEDPRCFPWVGETIGKVEGKFGKFYCVGNHELKLPDVDVLRFELYASGWMDLGSRVRRIRVRDVDILIAGNELPWFGRAPEMGQFAGESMFRLLVSHTPDNYAWAREQRFNLMLSGHNHGGQIRFPLVGAVIAPSRFGACYASGVFDLPPTVLHVSRGLGGTHPIRLNCPPELALLKLIR
jgi:predicted MPP superfamily phosphohydrolase